MSRRYDTSTSRTPLLVAAAFAGGALVATVARATPSDASPYDVLAQLARVLVIAERHHVDAAPRERLLEGAITGMVEKLDPHSSYMPPKEYAAFQADTEGKFGGVGIELDARDDVVTILAPIDGGPAARAGVLPGDVLVRVNDDEISAASLARLVRRLRGEPGTAVRVTVRRAGDDGPRVFDLVREVIHVKSVLAARLEGGVLYVRVKQFQDGTHDELVRTVAAAGARAAEHGVVLDLRRNPGGLVDEAVAIADEWLDEGTVFTTQRRGVTVDDERATRGGLFVGARTALLVDRWSASSSELLAGALADHHVATVIGEPTFGKGSVQSILDLPGGAGLRLTTLRYYTPRGRSIQAVGIGPEIAVVDPAVPDDASRSRRERDLEGHLAAERAPALDAARLRVEARGPKGGPRLAVRAEDVPPTPDRAADPALHVAWRVARGEPPTP